MDQQNYYRTEFQKFGLSKETIEKLINKHGGLLCHEMPNYWVGSHIQSELYDLLPHLDIDSYIKIGFTEITALQIIQMINEEMKAELASLNANYWALLWCRKCNILE